MRALVSLLLLAGCPSHRPVQGPAEPRSVFEDGVTLLQEAGRDGTIDYEAAYQKFSEAERLGAGPRASFDAGWVAERLGRPDQAIEHYRRAADTAPGYEAASRSLVRLLVARGEGDEALVRLRALTEREPQLRIELLSLLVDLGHHDEALEQARALLRKDPEDAGVYRELSRLYAAQGQRALAELTAEKALALEPDNAETLNDLGVLALSEGDGTRAVARFQAALALDPQGFAPNANLGLLALAAGDHARARRHLEAAQAADPTHLETAYSLALACRGAGDTARAAALLDAILERDPGYDPAALAAAALHEPSEPRRAARYLRAYAARHPELPPTDPVYQRIASLETRASTPKDKGTSDKKLTLLLERAAQTLQDAKASLEANRACLDPLLVEQTALTLEQGGEILALGDLGMAEELAAVLEQTAAQLREGISASCGR